MKNLVNKDMKNAIGMKEMKNVLSIYFHVKWKLESSPDLRKYRYHGWLHTKTHYDAVCYLAALEKINDEDTKLLKIASLFHDTGYIINVKDHEYESANIARKELSPFGYSDYEIDKVCRLILSTKPTNNYTDVLDGIMKDADLEYLGRDYYPYVSELIRIEKGIVLTNSWREEQLDFLQKHKFITYSAHRLYDRQKEMNIKYLKDSIDKARHLEIAEIFVKEPSSIEVLLLLSDEGSKTISQISECIIYDTKITVLLNRLESLNLININEDLVEISELGKDLVTKLRKAEK